VIWLPPMSSGFEVAEVVPQVGQWLPFAGTPVLISQPAIVEPRVVISESFRRDASNFSTLLFSPQDGSSTSPVDSNWLIPAVDAARFGSVAAGNVSGQADADSAGDDPVKLQGFVTAQAGRTRLQVPIVAIVEEPGRTCIYSQTEAGPVATEIQPTGSSLSGVTYIEGDVSGGDVVLLNPFDLGFLGC